MKKLRVFVASPGDVEEERNVVSLVVDGLRRITNKIQPVELETVRWETHSWPDVGDDAQDVINREIGEYDIFVGIMWKRFGTPTHRASSGTDEEFEKAYKYFKAYKRPKVMFYFRTTPFYTTDSKEIAQFKKVIDFRKRLQKLGVFFWEYDEPIWFERYLREHLMQQILDLKGIAKQQRKPSPRRISRGTISPAPMIFMSYVREDRARVEPIYHELKKAGFNPWFDVFNLLPGQNWNSEITKAISASDFMLLFISSYSAGKRGYFQREVKIAVEKASSQRSVRLIPVRLDDARPPEELTRFQWLDYFSPNGLEKLISIIKSQWESHK